MIVSFGFPLLDVPHQLRHSRALRHKMEGEIFYIGEIYMASKPKSIIFTYDYTVLIQTGPTFE
jgi:hypothetical protein